MTHKDHLEQLERTALEKYHNYITALGNRDNTDPGYLLSIKAEWNDAESEYMRYHMWLKLNAGSDINQRETDKE